MTESEKSNAMRSVLSYEDVRAGRVSPRLVQNTRIFCSVSFGSVLRRHQGIAAS